VPKSSIATRTPSALTSRRRSHAAILGVGQSLSLSVVAEGIEEHEQQITLEEMGCEMAQGFLLGHPGAAGDIETLLAQREFTAVSPSVA
jgi:EAL domain-containing protein (putative c-di-GMP-specific phosphodiesterase class I)